MTFMRNGVVAMVMFGGVVETADGLSEFVIRREDRLGLAKASRRILLVEVTAVVESHPKQTGGFTSRQISVRGRVREVLRGDPSEEWFLHQVDLIELNDRKAFEEATGRQPNDVEMTLTADRDDTGVKECEVGSRVLVIDLGKTHPLWRMFFYRVSSDDNSWRSKIPKFDPELKLPGSEATAGQE